MTAQGLTVDEGIERHLGGTVTYCVDQDGRWIGWVGDGREWRGHRYGERRWWACWRQDGDTAARWSTGLEFRSRRQAHEALLGAVLAGPQ